MTDRRPGTFHMVSVIDKRAALLCKEDLTTLLSQIDQRVGQRLHSMQQTLTASLPSFVIFGRMAEAIQGLEAELRDFLAEEHSEHLVLSLSFSPPINLNLQLGVDSMSDYSLSSSVH